MTALQIEDHLSPNFGPRRDGLRPQLIVIHYTAMESAEAAIERLCDPVAEVSAHYLIANSGLVTRLVSEERRAWHAGQGAWRGLDDINSRSIGIELDNRGDHPFSEPQMAALETLLTALLRRWNIPAAGVIGHSDMAPGRKTDPGAHFDWARLARQGLAAELQSQQIDHPGPEIFCQAATEAGYPAEIAFDSLLQAVRLRCAPWRKGPLDSDDFTFPRV